MGIKIKMVPPALIKSAVTIYAVVGMKDETTGKTNNVAMGFPPSSPMYYDVVDAGIAFATLEFCQKFSDESTILEARIRKEENDFLNQKVEEPVVTKPEKKVKAVKKVEKPLKKHSKLEARREIIKSEKPVKYNVKLKLKK